MNLVAATGTHNPFPGLRPFREGEEHLYFGRESQVDTMIDKLARARFLGVVGTSGSGKSSLVNCGLRPALHRGLMTTAGTSWRIAQFRPGRNPVRQMAHALAASGVLFSNVESDGFPLVDVVEATLRLSKLGLVDICEQAQLSGDVNLLIVVDQFEELFRYRSLGGSADDSQSRSQDATAFVNLLLEPKSHPNLAIYVVLTMRSDFLGDCAEFEGLPEAINESQYLVPRMTREERRAAIAGPVGVGGGEMSPVLLTRLVNDVGDNPDQLSILQHALNRTWARWRHEGQGDNAMSLPHYEAVGTMAHALDRHAEKAYRELQTDRQRAICEKIFKALTDKGTDSRGIRRPTSLANLAALADTSLAEVTEVINVFRKPSRSFLMPPLADRFEPDTVVDISHESLMRVWERLKNWAEEEALSAAMYRRVAETAVLRAARKAGLWRDPDLQLALDWHLKEHPTAAWAALYGGDFSSAMSFLEESKAAHDKELAEVELERRWRGSWGVIILITTLGVFLFEFQGHSKFLLGSVSNLLASGSKVLAPLKGMGISTLIVLPYLIAYLLLIHYGKKLYRRLAFNGILHYVAAGPTKIATVEAVVALQTSYAAAWRRVLAYGVDLLIFLVEFVVAVCIDLILAPYVPALKNPDTDWMFGYAGVFTLDWLYQAITVSSAWQGTLGMKLTGIIITDIKGKRISFARSSVRYLAKLLSYYSFLIGFFLIFVTKKRQTLHDLVARTVVLRRRKKVSVSEVQAISAPSADDSTTTSLAPMGLGRTG